MRMVYKMYRTRMVQTQFNQFHDQFSSTFPLAKLNVIAAIASYNLQS